MDEALQRRLELFEQTGQAEAQVCRFVAAELATVTARGLTVTEDSAGTLTSHLVLALQRGRNGEPVTQFPAADVISAELASHPDALQHAHELADRARTALAVTLPEQEVRFLALHLAALTTRAPNPKR